MGGVKRNPSSGMPVPRDVALCGIAVWMAMAGGIASAQTAYPNRPLRFVVPYAAGGNGDIVARIIAQKLATQIGQQIVIDNRGGAGGNIGAELAARAAPDGYTLMLGTNTHAINMSLFAKPGYDIQRDFAPITLSTSAPMILIVHPALPAKNGEGIHRPRQIASRTNSTTQPAAAAVPRTSSPSCSRRWPACSSRMWRTKAWRRPPRI